jgi:hypothetical protein
MSEIEAWLAGQWNVCPIALISMIKYTCQIANESTKNRYASHKDARAMIPSATSITFRRSQRSIKAPTNGPKITPGSIEIRVAKARMVADPVFSVIHQTKPNWAIALPTQERVCPVQIVKNKGAHFDVFQAMDRFPIVYLSI